MTGTRARLGALLALVASAVVAGCGGDKIATADMGSPGACAFASGNICTVAGTGVAGDGADGLAPLATMLYLPADLAFDPAGRMVIVDWNNHRIRALQPDGRLKIVAGTGELTPDLGTDLVTNRLNHPTDVTFDSAGRMIIAAWHNSRIKRLDLATGAIEDIAGTGKRDFGGDGGPALAAVLNLPASVVYDPDGNLYISDQANQRIRRVDPSGIIQTVAGSGLRGFGGDGGPALAASFKLPIGQSGHPAAHIARGPAGDLYLADTEDNRVRHIDPTGTVSTLAGTGNFGAAGDGGPATMAELAGPVDVAVAPDGAIYVADTENHCVRRVRDGVLSTVAGACGKCTGPTAEGCSCPSTDGACLGDGGPALAAHLLRPSGIAFDRDGNLYIADTSHHRIRVVYR
jgi:hypothetical protein